MGGLPTNQPSSRDVNVTPDWRKLLDGVTGGGGKTRVEHRPKVFWI